MIQDKNNYTLTPQQLTSIIVLLCSVVLIFIGYVWHENENNITNLAIGHKQLMTGLTDIRLDMNTHNAVIEGKINKLSDQVEERNALVEMRLNRIEEQLNKHK